MANKNKLDIGHVLKQVNKANLTYFDHLEQNEDRKKMLSPFVLFYYMKGAKANRAGHTVLNNEFVNPYLFDLGAHPLLLYKLIVTANSGFGEGEQYQFVKPNKRPLTKQEKAVIAHFNCSVDEARGIIEVIDSEELQHIQEVYEQ